MYEMQDSQPKGITLEPTSEDVAPASQRAFHGSSPLVGPHVPAISESPSLRRGSRSAPPSYEMKFLLTETLAKTVEGMLRSELTLDPHSDPQQGDGYRITTLYCDTPELDVFHRRGRHKLSKFRLRRYGDSEHVFLERKSKQGTQVRKQRSVIDAAGLSHFAHHKHAADWPGRAYSRHLHRNALRPVCVLEYARVAYYGTCSMGPIRLTFDRQVRGALTSDWSLVPTGDWQSLLGEQVVCEFKFRDTLPSLFKNVIHTLQLSPRGVSKYRHCLQLSGLAENGKSGHA